MIDLAKWDDLVTGVAKLNELDEETADMVVAMVGDARLIDEDGLYVAKMPDGRELHVRWPGVHDREERP